MFIKKYLAASIVFSLSFSLLLAQPAWAESHINAGFQSHSTTQTFDDSAAGTVKNSDSSLYLGAGFSNIYGSDQQHSFGMGIDFEHILGDRLIGLRALDYQLKVHKYIKVGGFFGAATLDSGAAQNGYYYGVNLALTETVKHLDIVLEMRFGDGLARDRITGDPAGTPPDIFMDYQSSALYARWNF
ncbi:MAG: hypothetical protein ACI93R_003464 [Flavobacteriales bacterium]|jgi:hypothetical protein